MSVVTTVGLPFGRPLTADDLAALPDDGHRYELLDGTLLVTPAPGYSHQSVQLELAVVLRTACPPELRVLTAPFAVRLSPSTELQPDVLVAPLRAFTAKNLPAAPLLAVEIRSPSTALIDLNLKRAAYARHGVESYWIVDPDPVAPAVLVLELTSDQYIEVAHARGDDQLDVVRPFAVRLRPTDLIDPGTPT